ncbi:MAG: penicillin-binding protein activator [Desulfobacterales bacterium]|nr:penicillin-binding protein activator [Desulfobacterales bacterium]
MTPGAAVPLTKDRVRQLLMTEAQALAENGSQAQALSLYNTLLADGEVDPGPVLKALEKVLIQSPSAVLMPLLEDGENQIPKPLLTYWLGVNLSREKAYGEAGKVLSSFVDNYPAHRYASEATELLSIIRQTFVKKETIGCILPLTGKYGVYGQRALKGVQLALQDLSIKYNRSFRVLIKDTGSDPQRAVASVDELDQENVMAILGPLLAVEEAGKRSQELGIPMIALTQKSEFCQMGDFLFSNFITPEMQVQTLAAYAFLELGVKKVAIFYPDERYGERYKELFWDAVDLFDGQVVGVESYDGKKTDFTKAIRKLTGEAYPVPDYLKQREESLELQRELLGNSVLLSHNEWAVQNDVAGPEADKSEAEEDEKIEIQFDAVFIPDDVSRVNLILPQLAFNDATGMYLLGTNLWNKDKLLKETRGYNKKTIIIDGYFSQSKRPATARFDKAFKTLFGAGPAFLEAVSYDTAAILFESAISDTVGSRQDLRDLLAGHRIFEGVTGNTIFDASGQARKQMFLLTIKRNRFVEIYP